VALLDDETKAKCSSCGTVMSATSSGGTSHMQRHLTRACNSLPTRAAARFVKKVADDARRARRRQSPPPLTNTSVSTYIPADSLLIDVYEYILCVCWVRTCTT
jgi:hypothetical protein